MYDFILHNFASRRVDSSNWGSMPLSQSTDTIQWTFLFLYYLILILI